MGVTVTVMSQKGGTGKTTSVRTLADVLRRQGFDVICVDLDPQGNLSEYFDVPDDASPTIADVLAGEANAVEALYDGILPANVHLAGVELQMASMMGRELLLKRALRDLRDSHDVVLVDCPPSLGLLTVNALVAADHVLIASEAEHFSLQGVEQALVVVDTARDMMNPDLDWVGLVLTKADMRLVHARSALSQLEAAYPGKLLAPPIRRSVRYAESAERGSSILDHAPDLGADYVALAAELVARIDIRPR